MSDMRGLDPIAEASALRDRIPESDCSALRLDHLPDAERLLIECEDVVLSRGDEYLCDCIDNDGTPYQSAELNKTLTRLRETVKQNIKSQPPEGLAAKDC